MRSSLGVDEGLKTSKIRFAVKPTCNHKSFLILFCNKSFSTTWRDILEIALKYLQFLETTNRMLNLLPKLLDHDHF